MGKRAGHDIERLNALVDGELEPAERAAMAARLAADRNFARAHATLARLKACVIETARAHPGFSLPMPQRRAWHGLAAGAAALAAVLALIAVFVAIDFSPDDERPMLAASEAIITQASLPVRPVIPELASGGLTLVNVAVEDMQGERRLIATYRGPRGCRLELRVQRADAIPLATRGSSRHAWQSDGLAYELVAFGMPAKRFSILAAAAEQQTRPTAPDRSDRLREARVAAPPCLA
jgi:anti-sigma factor RsiW